MDPLLRATLIGACTAAVVDLTAFVNARSKDKTVAFDFALCGARVLLGVIIGFSGGHLPVTGQVV